MKSLFKLFAIAAVAVGLGAGSASAQIKLGLDSSPYPPFASKDASGKQIGWEIEIGEALCKAMGEECVWTPIAWDGIIPALVAKKLDAIVASMSITAERQKTIAFSDKYYNTPAVIVAAKSSSISGDPASVKGKTIGVQVSTTHQNYAQKHLKDATVKTYQAFDEHNADLFAGRIDAVVGDAIAIKAFLDSAEGKGFEVKGELTDVDVFGPGVGVGMRKEDTALRDKFNAAIKKIRADGTYDAITKKYFDFDIYGG